MAIKGQPNSRLRQNGSSNFLVKILIAAVMALILVSMNIVNILAIFFGVFALASLVLSMALLMKKHPLRDFLCWRGRSIHFGRGTKYGDVERGSYNTLDPELQSDGPGSESHDYRHLECRLHHGTTHIRLRASNAYEEIPLSCRRAPDSRSLERLDLPLPPTPHRNRTPVSPAVPFSDSLPPPFLPEMTLPTPYPEDDLPQPPLPIRMYSTLPPDTSLDMLPPPPPMDSSNDYLTPV